MAWLTENWIWVLFGVAFIAMHLFGHGGHGGQGGHGGHGGGHGGHGSSGGGNGDPDKAPTKQAGGTTPSASAGNREAHRH